MWEGIIARVLEATPSDTWPAELGNPMFGSGKLCYKGTVVLRAMRPVLEALKDP